MVGRFGGLGSMLAAAILGGSVIAAAIILAAAGRYEIGGGAGLFRVARLTGEVVACVPTDRFPGGFGDTIEHLADVQLQR